MVSAVLTVHKHGDDKVTVNLEEGVFLGNDTGTVTESVNIEIVRVTDKKVYTLALKAILKGAILGAFILGGTTAFFSLDSQTRALMLASVGAAIGGVSGLIISAKFCTIHPRIHVS